MRAGNARRHRCSTVTVGRAQWGGVVNSHPPVRLKTEKGAIPSRPTNSEPNHTLGARPPVIASLGMGIATWSAPAKQTPETLVGGPAAMAMPGSAAIMPTASSAPTSLFRISPPLRLSGPGPKADLNPPSLAISRRGMSPPGRHHLLAGTAVPRELPSHLLGRQWSTGPSSWPWMPREKRGGRGCSRVATFSRCVQGLSRRQGSPTSHQGRYTLGSDSRYRSCRKRPEPC